MEGFHPESTSNADLLVTLLVLYKARSICGSFIKQ